MGIESVLPSHEIMKVQTKRWITCVAHSKRFVFFLKPSAFIGAFLFFLILPCRGGIWLEDLTVICGPEVILLQFDAEPAGFDFDKALWNFSGEGTGIGWTKAKETREPLSDLGCHFQGDWGKDVIFFRDEKKEHFKMDDLILVEDLVLVSGLPWDLWAGGEVFSDDVADRDRGVQHEFFMTAGAEASPGAVTFWALLANGIVFLPRRRTPVSAEDADNLLVFGAGGGGIDLPLLNPPANMVGEVGTEQTEKDI